MIDAPLCFEFLLTSKLQAHITYRSWYFIDEINQGGVLCRFVWIGLGWVSWYRRECALCFNNLVYIWLKWKVSYSSLNVRMRGIYESLNCAFATDDKNCFVMRTRERDIINYELLKIHISASKWNCYVIVVSDGDSDIMTRAGRLPDFRCNWLYVQCLKVLRRLKLKYLKIGLTKKPFQADNRLASYNWCHGHRSLLCK